MSADPKTTAKQQAATIAIKQTAQTNFLEPAEYLVGATGLAESHADTPEAGLSSSVFTAAVGDVREKDCDLARSCDVGLMGAEGGAGTL